MKNKLNHFNSYLRFPIGGLAYGIPKNAAYFLPVLDSSIVPFSIPWDNSTKGSAFIKKMQNSCNKNKLN